MRFLFISRHTPTESQVDLARSKGIELIHAGDLDAFSPDLAKQIEELDYKFCPDHGEDLVQGAHGIVCVHPVIALTAKELSYKVGVFNNVNRAPVGEKPQFETTQLVIF